MDTDTGKISKCQEIYIKQLKESHLKNHADIRVLYPADSPYTDGVSQPKVNDYYRKPCMVFAPHIQFPEVFAKLKCVECKKCSLKPKEWASKPSARYIHDIDGSMYFLSYLYSCTCSTKKMYYQDLSDQLPDFMKLSYPFRLTTKSGYTDRLISFMVTSVTSRQTIEEFVNVLGNLRIERYLYLRALYCSAVQYYNSVLEASSFTSSDGILIPKFSNFDNPVMDNGVTSLLPWMQGM